MTARHMVAYSVRQERPSDLTRFDADAQLLTSRGENDWSQHVAETAAETGLSGTNGLFEVASKTYRDKARRAKASMDEADYASSSDDEGPGLQQGRGGTQLIRTHSVLRSACTLMRPHMLPPHLDSPVLASQWGDRLPAVSIASSVQHARSLCPGYPQLHQVPPSEFCSHDRYLPSMIS